MLYTFLCNLYNFLAICKNETRINISFQPISHKTKKCGYRSKPHKKRKTPIVAKPTESARTNLRHIQSEFAFLQIHYGHVVKRI